MHTGLGAKTTGSSSTASRALPHGPAGRQVAAAAVPPFEAVDDPQPQKVGAARLHNASAHVGLTRPVLALVSLPHLGAGLDRSALELVGERAKTSSLSDGLQLLDLAEQVAWGGNALARVDPGARERDLRNRHARREALARTGVQPTRVSLGRCATRDVPTPGTVPRSRP